MRMQSRYPTPAVVDRTPTPHTSCRKGVALPGILYMWRKLERTEWMEDIGDLDDEHIRITYGDVKKDLDYFLVEKGEQYPWKR